MVNCVLLQIINKTLMGDGLDATKFESGIWVNWEARYELATTVKGCLEDMAKAMESINLLSSPSHTSCLFSNTSSKESHGPYVYIDKSTVEPMENTSGMICGVCVYM